MKLCIDSVVFASRFPHLTAIVSALQLDIEEVVRWKYEYFPTATDELFDVHVRCILVRMQQTMPFACQSKRNINFFIRHADHFLPILPRRTQYFVLAFFEGGE